MDAKDPRGHGSLGDLMGGVVDDVGGDQDKCDPDRYTETDQEPFSP